MDKLIPQHLKAHKPLNKKSIELIVILWLIIKQLRRKNKVSKRIRVVWGVGE